jgi:ABC-type oligopeptide transport system ATPase subunit
LNIQTFTPLKIDNLVKRYGAFEAVKKVSFEVKAGEIFGLLGPNGAGKTSIISIITTLEKPTEGHTLVFGEDVTINPMFTKRKIGIVHQEVIHSGFFDVEEYVSAAFKLEAKSDKEEYIAGDTAAVSIDANYYFGVPVEGGTVEYSIASQDYYFDKYHDEYFQFGSGWYSCYYDCRYGDQFILRNTVPLSQNGKATIRQPLDYKTLFTNEADRKSKIFVMYITVKDKTGKIAVSQLMTPECESIVITSTKGQVVKLPAKSIPTLGRATSGVILMRFADKNDTISAATCLSTATG